MTHTALVIPCYNEAYELPLHQWKDTGPTKVTPADALRAAFDLVRLYRTSRQR